MNLPRNILLACLLVFGLLASQLGHAVQVTIQTGAYQGQLDVGNDGNFFSGPMTLDLAPGTYFIRPGSQFRFHLDASGLVTLDPEYDGISAIGGMNELTLLTVPVTIDPGAFAGDWSISNGRTQPDTRGAATVQLVPSNAINGDGSVGAAHTVEIGVDTSKIVMYVRGDGSLSVADGNDALAGAVDVNGSTLSFKNVSISVTDRDASGILWFIRQATPDWPVFNTGDLTFDLVPGVRYLFQSNTGVSENFWVYEPCSTSISSVDVGGSFFDIACASPPGPSQIRVRFSGTMNIIDDSTGFLARAGIENGDLLTGTFVYDVNTPPTNQNSSLAQYWPEEYSFTIGGNKASYVWPTMCCGSGLVIRDNFSSIGDMFSSSFSGDLVNTATGEIGTISTTNGWIADNTGTSWSGTALPGFDVLSDFVDPATNPGYQSFSRIQGTGIDFTLGNYTWIVEAGDEPPVAVAGDDQAARVGDTVFLDGTQSFDDNTDSQNLVYSWSFVSLPAGSMASFDDASSSMPSFTADVDGNYVIELVVADSLGQNSAADVVEISSENLAPTAVAGSDQLIILGETVLFDGSQSFDPENDPISFAWSIDTAPTGSMAQLTGAAAATASLTPDLEGSYAVSLVVSDAIGPGLSDSATVIVVTPESFAETSIVSAVETLNGLPRSAVRKKGNRKALRRILFRAIAAIDAGDFAKAIARLERAAKRVDGCVERGAPDGNGKGRDWVLDCAAQTEMYTNIVAARDALLAAGS